MHWDMTSLAEVLVVCIPIVAIVGGLATGMVAIVADYRRKREMFEMHHKERMAAIERGVDLPPLPPELLNDDPAALQGLQQLGQLGRSGWAYRRNPLRRGLVWLFIGLGLFAALTLNRDLQTASWALIPIGMGLGNLLFFALARGGIGGSVADGRPGPLR